MKRFFTFLMVCIQIIGVSTLTVTGCQLVINSTDMMSTQNTMDLYLGVILMSVTVVGYVYLLVEITKLFKWIYKKLE